MRRAAFFPRYTFNLKKEAAVFFLFILALCLLRISALTSLSTLFLGGFSGDGGLYVWLTSGGAINALSGGPFAETWFNTSAFFPYTKTLGYSDAFIFPALIIEALTTLGLTHLVAYNLTLLAASVLNGFITYLLSYRLFGNRIGATLSGASFMLCAYLTYNIGHPQLQFAFFLPTGLLFLALSLSRKLPLYAFLFGATLLLSFLTTVYYALFLVVIAAVFWLTLLTIRFGEVEPRQFFRFILFSALGALPLICFIEPYLNIQKVFGKRGIYEAYYFSASLRSFLSAPPSQLLYAFTSKWTHGEAHLFSGLLLYASLTLAFYHFCATKVLKKRAIIFVAFFVLTALTASSRVFQYLTALLSWVTPVLFLLLIRDVANLERRARFHYLTNRALLTLLLSIALIFFLISLGPLGNPEKDQVALGLYRVFYEFLPGFSSIRAISRTGIVVLLVLCVAISYGTLNLKKSKYYVALCSAFLPLFLFENLLTKYPLEAAAPLPEVLSSVDQHKSSNSVIAFLPFTDHIRKDGQVKSWGDFASKNVTYMNWSNKLGIPTVNGYSGQRTHIMKNFPRKLMNFPDRRSIEALSLIPNIDLIYYEGDNVPVVTTFPELTLLESDSSGKALYKFSPSTKIRGEFYLRVPSLSRSFLTLTVQGLYERGTPVRRISVIEKDHYNGKILAHLPVRADGKERPYKVMLPEALDPARPFRIVFDVDKGFQALLKKREWKPAP